MSNVHFKKRKLLSGSADSSSSNNKLKCHPSSRHDPYQGSSNVYGSSSTSPNKIGKGGLSQIASPPMQGGIKDRLGGFFKRKIPDDRGDNIVEKEIDFEEDYNISFVDWMRENEEGFGEEVKKIKEELEKGESFNERRRCYICRGPWYTNAYTYYLHLNMYPGHQRYRKLRQRINQLKLNLLQEKARLAEDLRMTILKKLKKDIGIYATKAVVNDFTKDTEKQIMQNRLRIKSLQKKSSEALIFERFKRKWYCGLCKVVSLNIDDHEEHLCSMEHTEKALNRKSDSTHAILSLKLGVNPKTEEMKKMIEEARVAALGTPASLGLISQYKSSQLYGLEKFQFNRNFSCVLCNVLLNPGEVEEHLRDVLHCANWFEHIEDREEMRQERERKEQLCRLEESTESSENASREGENTNRSEVDYQQVLKGKGAEVSELGEPEEDTPAPKNVHSQGDDGGEGEGHGEVDKLLSEDSRRPKPSSEDHKPDLKCTISGGKVTLDEDQDQPSAEEIAKALKIMEKIKAMHNL